ncbi:MAG: hypothetical protein H8E16_06570 [Flavobacteriales bacterium]|nr:hypothetical protein [Flavobacteriales bacterium]
MKTLQEQYNLIKEGKGHKDVFLKEAKLKFPGMINNAATYDQATHILKNRSVISENYIDLKPINTIEPTAKQNWEDKFANFLAEAGDKSLNPIVNNDMKANTKESEEKVSSDSKLKFEMETNQTGRYKISDGVENIASHNYDYSPKVDNINNVNAQEMMNGVYCEIKNNPKLTLEEAQEKVIKNLAKDSLHYVKEGQFGVAGLGYQQESAGLPDVDSQWSVVKEGVQKVLKESLNSFTAKLNEDSFDEARDKAIEASQEKAGMEEEARPDYPDIDGDGDTKEPMAKAAKDKEKNKKVKKESIDSRLAEIGKEAEAVKLEAQLDFLHDHIQEKVDRVNSINEDDNLKELIDKSKMKQMQREIKDLERKKLKMEKIYEKSCGKKYSKKEMVDETEEVDESFDSVVDKIMDSGKSKEDAEKIAGAINAKHVGNYRS